jgi:hypothetical protein
MRKVRLYGSIAVLAATVSSTTFVAPALAQDCWNLPDNQCVVQTAPPDSIATATPTPAPSSEPVVTTPTPAPASPSSVSSPPAQQVQLATPDSMPVAYKGPLAFASSGKWINPNDIAYFTSKVMVGHAFHHGGMQVHIWRSDARYVRARKGRPGHWKRATQVFAGCDVLSPFNKGRWIFTNAWIDTFLCAGVRVLHQPLNGGYRKTYRHLRAVATNHGCGMTKQTVSAGLSRKLRRYPRSVRCGDVRYGDLNSARLTWKMSPCRHKKWLKPTRRSHEMVLKSDQHFILRRCGKKSFVRRLFYPPSARPSLAHTLL